MKRITIYLLVCWIAITSFNPARPAPQTKYICIQVISEPPGAQAIKSHPSDQLSTYIGITPVVKCFSTTKIFEGSSTILVTKPGYEPWKLEIDLSGYYDSLPAAQEKAVLIQAVLKPLH